MTPAAWLGVSLALPLAMLLACLWPAARDRMLPWLAWAPLPALLAALGVEREAPLVVIAVGAYRGALVLDAPGALLLGVAALLWSAAGAYAATYQRGQPNRGRFAAGWLLCLTGCIGVFLAADMPLLYLMMATMTLGAGALVFQDESAGARRAAGIYLGLALAGETLVLIAMILLVQAMPDGSLLIRDAAAALPTSRQRDLIVVLLLIGFGLKAGLVPLHVWMPLAHAAAPMPASAVLSGVVVKAGIIGLIRFLPVDAALADWGNTLALVGMFTALYAVAIGITQSHPKVVLAYSSVSQMGFTAAVIGMGIVNLETATPVLAAFYATHHILVKGAMFLLVGVVAATAATRLRGTLLLAIVLALGLGGLPLTGGALAKLAVKGPLGSGWAETVGYASAIGTTLLMLHFVRRVATVHATAVDARAPAGLHWPWLVTAIAAIVVPWVLYLVLSLGAVAEILAPKALWASLWPVAVGAALAWMLARAGDRLPRVPPGDIAVVIGAAAPSAARASLGLARLDVVLRQWAVAGVSMLAIAALFGAALY
ncbi:MAG TPA: proton-conducting transporter membrane subunit [Burkholderiaceae bacterium]|nr:proton-conducting transporter membrane subunit [Burkholderiaceae bacterium]